MWSQLARDIDQRINELVAALPVGISVERISWQSDQVSESIRAFMVSLIEAVVIVLALLAVTMGIRSGIIIGISGLVFPILGTFVVMSITGIDLHRISLGALIIAMGMMVDNAIVVTDGIMVRIYQGMDRKQAAIEAASGPAMPLLGATVVACMAFYPIFASSYDTGEYAGSLYTVVAISLLFSWVFCQTVGPLLCMAMLPWSKTWAGHDRSVSEQVLPSLVSSGLVGDHSLSRAVHGQHDWLAAAIGAGISVCAKALFPRFKSRSSDG